MLYTDHVLYTFILYTHDDWRGKVENIVRDCIEMSVACEDNILDREIDSAEISRCLKNNKTGGSDGLVGELLKYGGSGMVDLLQQLFSVIFHNVETGLLTLGAHAQRGLLYLVCTYCTLP